MPEVIRQDGSHRQWWARLVGPPGPLGAGGAHAGIDSAGDRGSRPTGTATAAGRGRRPRRPAGAGPAPGWTPSYSGCPAWGFRPVWSIPKPTAETEKKFGQFVEHEANPENTLRVVAGRALVLVFREAPRRIYIPREDVAEYQTITPQQLAVMGKKEGSTVLNIWFANPARPDDPSQDTY